MGKKSKLGEETEIKNEATENAPVSASYEERLKYVTAIAKPMASRKLTKKIHKLVRKANKDKDRRFFFDGLKQVQMKLRKGEKGLVIFSGDVLPVDIMIHLPGVCEELEVPYCYVPSREDLGEAMGVRRSVVTVMVKENEPYGELYNEILNEIKNLPTPV